MKNKKQCGKPQEIIVKNLFDSKTLIYPSIYTASQTYFPDKSAGYLSARMFHADSIYDDNLGLLFLRSGNDGMTHNQKSYRVIDKRDNRKFCVVGTGEVLKLILNGNNNFFKQFKSYGNYDDTRYTIWKV